MGTFMMVFGWIIVPSVQAQEMPESAPDPVEVTAETIEKVALAYVDVQMIQYAYQPMFAEAGSEEEVMDLQQKMASDLVQAVEGRGIEVDYYDAVIYQAQDDLELREELIRHIEQIVEELQAQVNG
jgi:hypothetical protein